MAETDDQNSVPTAGPFPWEQRPGVPGRPHSREERAAYIDAVTANIAD